MRCIIVNGAKLKAQARCAYCNRTIGEGYIREIGSRLIYCDFHCYSVALEAAVMTRAYPQLALGSWVGRP